MNCWSLFSCHFAFLLALLMCYYQWRIGIFFLLEVMMFYSFHNTNGMVIECAFHPKNLSVLSMQSLFIFPLLIFSINWFYLLLQTYVESKLRLQLCYHGAIGRRYMWPSPPGNCTPNKFDVAPNHRIMC